MVKLGLTILVASFLTPNLWAYDTKVLVKGQELPAELKGVGVEEHLGSKIDLGLQFTDESGALVPLSQYFKSGKPVLMAMVYYNCPGLCSYHLNGLTTTMKKLKWTSGQDFEVVAISMDHRETPDLASKKKQSYLKLYDRPNGDLGWHFLVGSEENVNKFADQVGFKFHWLEDKKEFSHASVAYIITPEGKISRYLNGIQIEPQTLRLGLIEASTGTIGNVMEQALMFCFQFNPEKGKYTLAAFNIMRIGGALMVFLLAIFLIPVWWRGRNQMSSRK